VAVNRGVNRVEIMDNMEILESVTTLIIISFKALPCDRIGECPGRAWRSHPVFTISLARMLSALPPSRTVGL